MVSVIISSINPQLLKTAMHSIEQTIGVDHEFIVYDNKVDHLGIGKVYNDSAIKSKYEYLCFVHEDVIFNLKNWGKLCIEFIESKNNIGIIGVAGGRYVPRNFISWGDNPEYDRYNFWQYSNDHGTYEHHYNNPIKEKMINVITLDGVFLFVKKSVWEKVRFDEKRFNGFHLYDADFSLSVSLSYDNYVCDAMQLLHRSSGNSTSKAYCDNLIIFHRKWKYILPKYIRDSACVNFIYKANKELINAFHLFDRFRPHYGIIKATFLIINNTSFLAIIIAVPHLLKKITRTVLVKFFNKIA